MLTTQNTVDPKATTSEIEASITHLIPILREYTPEEINAMRQRLEALLERRQVSVQFGDQPPARI